MALTATPACIAHPATSASSFDDFLAVLGNLRLAPRRIDIDIDRRRVTIDERNIDVTRQEFHLLSHLAQHADRAVSRDELLETVWSNRGLTTQSRTVDAHIRRLRAKLDDSDLITTVRGQGYRFNTGPGVRVFSVRPHTLAA